MESIDRLIRVDKVARKWFLPHYTKEMTFAEQREFILEVIENGITFDEVDARMLVLYANYVRENKGDE